MKVSGFTIIRNAQKFDYPVIEAIKSILPLCDEMVISVGKSEDDTLDLMRSIDSSKIRIVESVWDDGLRKGGHVLAVETNKALDRVAKDSDWCFYIQADEVYHEDDLPNIKTAMEENLEDDRVEGLVFEHINLYGTYDYVADLHSWMKREIRVIRNDPSIRSWSDAMSFRKNDRLMKVKQVDAHIYHYGWVRHPATQQERQKTFNKMWHDDDWMEENIPDVPEFDYSGIDSLKRFEGTHPSVMRARIEQMNWDFKFDPSQINISAKERLLRFIRETTGWRAGEYKNYKLIK